jgi:hypothetical protein
MKKAISISIGSSSRDKEAMVDILGEEVHISRVGTDGDMDKAAQLYRDLDGHVDAFGVGGADRGLYVDGKWYELHSVKRLFKDVKITPIVDGLGLKTTLEIGAAQFLDSEIPEYMDKIGRTVLVMTALDRFGLATSFIKANYQYTFGDMLYSLGINIPIHSIKAIKALAETLLPIISRVPFEWVYPTGESQNKRTPKYVKEFEKVSVIAGDCHYITRYMPDEMPGKVIVTNTTTPDDVALFTRAGVKYLLTTTPVLDGRSFGTNMMEAAIVAGMGRKQKVDYRHPDDHFAFLADVIQKMGMKPQLRELN